MKRKLPMAALMLLPLVGAGCTRGEEGLPSASSAELAGSLPSETREFQTRYTNGEYSASGNYISPGGPEEVGVTLTLERDMITDVTFTERAVNPISKNFQKMFADTYKPFVVGRSIDDVSLTKISGSSLTPQGFQDALRKIKTDASRS